MSLTRRYWPHRTRNGWIVGVSAIDTDVDPTVVTKQGAEDWAERLNARQEGTIKALEAADALADAIYEPVDQSVLEALADEYRDISRSSWGR